MSAAGPAGFETEGAVAPLPEPQAVEGRAVHKVGVVGGGTMGSGIATAILLAGLSVTVLEVSRSAADTARDLIAQNLRAAAARGKISAAEAEIALADRLVLATDYACLSDRGLVIEAVFEDIGAKTEVFRELEQHCAPGTVLATNTSYLDVNEIAAVTHRPQEVIGLHFFSPAHVMKLVEVVVPERAAPAAIATGFAFVKALGKQAVCSAVGDGFIGNRILRSYRAAADLAVLDGASPADVDRAMKDFGFAMGPYAVADLAGLDIGWTDRKRRHRAGHATVSRATFPDRLCEAGQFGRKSGRGYYLYDDSGQATGPNPFVLQQIDAERATSGQIGTGLLPFDIAHRAVAAMVNEAARILADGTARQPRDIDVVMMAGFGFPKPWGGPCAWADRYGIRALVSDLHALSQSDAALWTPAGLLRRMAEEGGRFGDLDAR